MHGLDRATTAETGVNEVSEEKLLRACEDFLHLSRCWDEGNPEGPASQLKAWSSDERWCLAIQRDETLEAIKNIEPVGISGLVAKSQVLDELVRWQPIDEGKALAFSLELIRNFKSVFLNETYSSLKNRGTKLDLEAGSTGKMNWRFNLHNIFGNSGS